MGALNTKYAAAAPSGPGSLLRVHGSLIGVRMAWPQPEALRIMVGMRRHQASVDAAVDVAPSSVLGRGEAVQRRYLEART